VVNRGFPDRSTFCDYDRIGSFTVFLDHGSAIFGSFDSFFLWHDSFP
jgi:hypothetical protein